MRRDTYHHGNLRSDLLKIAEEELENHGLAAISLRDLAERLGVARSAPYRHFGSRDELLQAIALNATDEIRRGFLASLESNAGPREKALGGFRWYLNFARRRPELYRLIFSTALDWHIDMQAEAQPHSSFGLFTQLIGGLSEGADDDEVHNRAVATWSILHGFAMLRQNSITNSGGFIAVAEEAVLALATQLDRLPIEMVAESASRKRKSKSQQG